MEMQFTLGSLSNYHLFGNNACSPGWQNGGGVILQGWDGITWGTIHWTAFENGGVGPFDWSGQLNAGLYRVIGQIQLRPFGTEHLTGEWNYTLQANAVPEPATMAALGAGALLLMRRRQARR
jgi:hypothetical protein